jgi:hypothetical protein
LLSKRINKNINIWTMDLDCSPSARKASTRSADVGWSWFCRLDPVQSGNYPLTLDRATFAFATHCRRRETPHYAVDRRLERNRGESFQWSKCVWSSPSQTVEISERNFRKTKYKYQINTKYQIVVGDQIQIPNIVFHPTKYLDQIIIWYFLLFGYICPNCDQIPNNKVFVQIYGFSAYAQTKYLHQIIIWVLVLFLYFEN